MAKKPSKASIDGADLLAKMREAIEEAHPGLPRQYDPLIEMAIYAANPALSDAQRLPLHRELAGYVYAKRKSIEIEGDAVSAPGITINQYVMENPNAGVIRNAKRSADDQAVISAPYTTTIDALPQRRGGERSDVSGEVFGVNDSVRDPEQHH